MISHLLKCIGLTGIAAALAFPALAAPTLRAKVTVNSAIVTVGDMFSDAGSKAETALFRAPAPGTSGMVSIAAIRTAAERAGLKQFETFALDRVEVIRAGVLVDENLLRILINKDLSARGIIAGDAYAEIALGTRFSPVSAAATTDPVHLIDLRYTPTNSGFTARFELAGVREPLEINGRLDLMISVPHLSNSLPAGTILGAGDLEMRPVSLRFADASGVNSAADLVGKELRRPARGGMLLRANDVMDPQLVKRNDLVTLIYRQGQMRLTVRGQALNAAAKGESVSVLNLLSKKIVHGIATGAGTVEMTSTSSRIAVAQSRG